VYLLSPASLAGKRAALLLRPGADFELARRLRGRNGVPLGEAFAFLSGLYFRGKLRYATVFARPPRGRPGVLVITADRGLLPPATLVGYRDLHDMAGVPIELCNPMYLEPLVRDARRLAEEVGSATRVVLLGSIATPKYTEPLLDVFGMRLRFPLDFVGRGDMSRGGLLLRQVDAGRPLHYVAIRDAVRHGHRPPRLAPRSG
jgi:hypothetical protein